MYDDAVYDIFWPPMGVLLLAVVEGCFVDNFRNSRIGIRNASLMLGVTVTELREAILGDKQVRGVTPPKPMYQAGQRRSEMMFRAGDVMDCADVITNLESNSACPSLAPWYTDKKPQAISISYL